MPCSSHRPSLQVQVPESDELDKLIEAVGKTNEHSLGAKGSAILQLTSVKRRQDTLVKYYIYGICRHKVVLLR